MSIKKICINCLAIYTNDQEKFITPFIENLNHPNLDLRGLCELCNIHIPVWFDKERYYNYKKLWDIPRCSEIRELAIQKKITKEHIKEIKKLI